MATIRDAGTKKEVYWPDQFSRKVFFIHGTVSDPNRWNKFPESLFVCNTIAMAPEIKAEKEMLRTTEWISKNCFFFNWHGDNMFSKGPDEQYNGFFNTVTDRAKAANVLIKEILNEKQKSNFDELVLIGHSHGSNVAIQAVNRLAEHFRMIYLVSIATPAQNKKVLTSQFPMRILGDPQRIYRTTVLKTDAPTPVDVYEYINPENPDSIKAWNKTQHLALWNSKDIVDEFGLGYDRFNDGIFDSFSGSGMTSNSDYFDSGHTTNYRFDIKNDYKNADRRVKIMELWRSKLQILRDVLYGCIADGYDLRGATLPQLKSFEEFEGTVNRACTPDELKSLQPDARFPLFLAAGSKPVYTGDRFRNWHLESLFVSVSAYGAFLSTTIDYSRQPDAGYLRRNYGDIDRTRDPLGFYCKKNDSILEKHSAFFVKIDILQHSIDAQYKINKNTQTAGPD